MKTSIRGRVILVIAVGVIALGTLIWQSGRNPNDSHEATPVSNVRSQPDDRETVPPRSSGERNQDAVRPPIASTEIGPTNLIERRRQRLEPAISAMNIPIRFYGRVVDQDGNPLQGVRVQLSTREWVLVKGIDPGSRHPKSELQTDATGYFALIDASGDDVMIEALTKEGYEPEPKALRGFGYTNSEKHTPDPKSPVVFRMWKTELKTKLISGSKRCSLVPDGRIYTVDLLQGTVFESATGEGDLRVSVKRAVNAAWGQHYDWAFELTGIGGGLAEEADRHSAMFRAPGVGYSNAYALNAAADALRWSYGTGTKRFFVKSRDGQQFARIEIEANAFSLQDKQARLIISYAVNASGQRLLR